MIDGSTVEIPVDEIHSITFSMTNIILIIFSVLIELFKLNSEKCRIFVTNKKNLD